MSFLPHLKCPPSSCQHSEVPHVAKGHSLPPPPPPGSTWDIKDLFSKLQGRPFLASHFWRFYVCPGVLPLCGSDVSAYSFLRPPLLTICTTFYLTKLFYTKWIFFIDQWLCFLFNTKTRSTVNTASGKLQWGFANSCRHWGGTDKNYFATWVSAPNFKWCVSVQDDTIF